MPAELQSTTTHDHDLGRHRRFHSSIPLQDGPAHCARPPFPIMPASSSSPSSSPQPDNQQQQQQQEQQKTSRGSSEQTSRRRADDGSAHDSADPRLATATPTPAILSSATSSSNSGAATPNGLASYQQLIKRYRVEVAASASSVLSTLTTFPLDSVKTRMQTYRYAGFLDCVRRTYQTEKFRGFFRGMHIRMIGWLVGKGGEWDA